MKKYLIAFLSLYMLASCRTLPNKGYEKILSNTFKTHIDSLEIIPKSKLELSKFQKFNLGEGDFNLYYSESDSNSNIIESLYETAQIDIENPGTYLVEIESICSCLGFEKLIFVPLLEIRDKTDNRKIEITPLNSELLHPSFSLPARLKKTWLFNTEKSGSYLLLFYSDNTKINSPLGQSSSFGYYGTLTYTVSTFKSNVTGNFRVKVEKI